MLTLFTILSFATNSFVRVSLRASSTVPFSKSFGPIPIRNGTPLSSYSLNFHPGLWVSLLSNFTEILFALSLSTISFATSEIASSCSCPLYIGTITT